MSFRLLPDVSCNNGAAYQGKDAKKYKNRNWSEWEYKMKEKQDVDHMGVKISLVYTFFTELE